MCKVSVALATYNGEKFIGEQLSSIIKQLNEHDELIISDNGSMDRTVEIINSFNDKRITLLHCAEKGLVPNFENALNKTTGDIIFLSDQDDVWLENKVQIVKKYLQNCDLVMSDSKVVDENLEVLHKSFFSLKNAGKGLIKNLISNTYQGCNMAFKKDVLKLSLPFPKNIPMHDIWIGFVADLFFSTCFIPEKLLLHRRHYANTSSSTNQSKYNFYKKLSFRFNVLRYYPLLIKRKYFSSTK